MLEIKSRLKVRRGAYKLEVRGALRLPFEARQKSRQRARFAGAPLALAGGWLVLQALSG